LFGDDVLIVVVNAVLFFQGRDFVIGLGMVGHVLAVVIRSFLLLVVFFPLLLRGCQKMAVMIVLVVLVVAILLVVVVAVAGPIIAMGIVGLALLLWDYEGQNIWHLNAHAWS
jgi:hypothetical protein